MSARCLATLAAALLAACPPAAHASYTWNWQLISNPHWEIMLTDFGYSDYLFDLTPGYTGREYLSGEWAAALAYRRGNSTVAPTWLEPRFSFPDWNTNSDYAVVQPMSLGALTAQGLPTMQSIVSDGRVQITQDVKFVDTFTGIAMGSVAASAGGAGSAITSNRYVMQQTYTFENRSGAAIDDLQFFQFLHGLVSQSGVYDNRDYGGQMAGFRHDLTMRGDSGSSGGQYDYIGFHSAVAPSAVEVGYFGTVEAPYNDDHMSGKPSVGTHLSVEANALSGVDNFAPTAPWIGGALRYDLGSLADGESKQLDIVLSIVSGWQVTGGGGGGSGGGGTIGGTGGSAGSVDYMFLGNHDPGQFFFEFSREDADSVAAKIALGEFGPLSFGVPGAELQLFEIEYEGSFSDGLRLTFHIDTLLLPQGTDLASLRLYHWHGGAWQMLAGSFQGGTAPGTAYVTVEVSSLSPFAVGAVPEPAARWLLAAGMVGIALRLRRRR